MDFQPEQKIGAAFKTLQIIHGALCLGPALLAAVSYIITTNKHNEILRADVSIVSVMAFVAISQVFISIFLFNNLMSQIDMKIPVKEKLIKFQTACLLRYVPLEMGALLNVIGFLITGNYISLGIAMATIVFMASIKPTRQGIIAALKINYPDTLD
jgi:hypothetical protein